jgi:hypothetical protein
MSDPDKGGGFTVSSFAVSLPVGILFLVIALGLFSFKETLAGFKLILWIGIPVMAFFIVFGVNLMTQYNNCRTNDAGKAALGALPSVGTTLLALLISSFSICRIPVASVFTPLLINDNSLDVVLSKSMTNSNSLKNSNSKGCGCPKMTIGNIESKFPIIEGIAYGFYLMFAGFFGVVIGNGYATIC